MALLETSEVTGLIIDWTAKAIKEKLDRNETVIRLLKKLGLDPDHPPADFMGVYSYALVEYGIGKPRPVLELFRSNEIQRAFRSAFEKNTPSILQAEAKIFLAAFKIGDDIRELRIDIFKEIDLFASTFHNVADRTRKPAEVKSDLKLDSLSEKLDRLIVASTQNRKRSFSHPFVLPQLDLAYFTGRDSELQQLEKLLLSEKGPKVAGIAGLTGTGGMGKSALAFHFAHKYRQRFPDGVIGLRVDGKSLETVAQRFASLAGVEINPEEGRSAAEIMQSVFRDQRALLIFDNAEEATVRALRPGGDRCAIIVTTRNRGLLLGLEIPSTAHIDLQRFDISETEALLKQLLGERAQNDHDAVRDIHDLVGGLPLALRIVGGTLADQPYTTLGTYIEILRHEKQRLSRLRDRDDPDLDVRASFAVSLKHLNGQENDLFACLSACVPDGFAIETAQVATGLSLPEVSSGLGRLHRLSLLNQGSKENRFVLHPLLHLFARELAEERKLLPAAEQRHTDYFVQYANEHKGLVPAKLDAIEQELDALLLTAKRLTEKQVADYGYYLALEPFFQSRGYWLQALDLIDSFSQVAEATWNWYVVVQFLLQRGQFLQLLGKFDEAGQILRESENRTQSIEDEWQRKRSQAMVLNSLGGVLQRQGKFDEAADAFQRSAAIEEKMGNRRGQAMVLNSLGGVLQRQGKFDEAVDAFHRSALIEEEIGNRRGQAMVLNSLGGVLQRQGKFDEAVGAIQHSHNLLLALGDDRGQAMVLNSLGGIFQRQGKFDEAVDALQRSAVIEEKLGNRRGQAMVLNSLGGVLQRQGKFEVAADAFQRSYAISKELGDQRSLAMVLNSLGGVLQRQGQFDEAADAFQRSYAISKELGDQRSLAMVLNSLGGVLQRQGKFEVAADAFQRSYAISKELGDQRSLAMVLNSLGGVLQRQGKFDEAADAFQRSTKIGNELGDNRHVAMALNSLGGVLQRQGKFDEAADAFQHSTKIGNELGDNRHVAMALNSLGGVLQRQGKFEEAADSFQRSYDLLVKLGDDRGQAMVLNSLGGVLQRQKRYDESVNAFQRSAQIGEKLGDIRHIAMALNSLGGALQRQEKFDEAVRVFQRSAAIEQQLENLHGHAMVLNSLGGVLQRQQKFNDAIDAYKRSAAILEELGDQRGLAMIHFGMGKALLENGNIQEAAKELRSSFEINETLKMSQGILIVTSPLVRALTLLGLEHEAHDYCNRALAIVPRDRRLLSLFERLTQQRAVDKELQIKRGKIKRLLHNDRENRYGFIIPDDGSPDIYFRETQVEATLRPILTEGMAVMAEIEMADRGPRARRVWSEGNKT